MHHTTFKEGDLVLVRDFHIEKTVSIARKVEDRYLGPYQVDRETRGKTYVLRELDGTYLRTPVAAYCLVPYYQRSKDLALPKTRNKVRINQWQMAEEVDPQDVFSTSEEETEDKR